MSETPFPPFNPNPSPPIAPEQPAAPKAKGRPKKAVEAPPNTPAEPRQKRKKANGDKPSLKFDLQTILGAAALLRRNLVVYGLGGVLAPFVAIKAIDLVVRGLHLG